MKRRDFLNLSAGSAIAALVPLPQMAAAATKTAAPQRLYVWAEAMARAGNPISQHSLGSALKVTPGQASALMEKLFARGVVAAPDAAGVARAVRPLFYGPGMPPGSLRTKGQIALRKALDPIAQTETRMPEKTAPRIETDDPVPGDETTGNGAVGRG